MTGWVVAVPTYRRAATLAAKTLPALAAAGVPASQIEVWLSDPAERDAYAAAVPAGSCRAIRDGAPTLRGNRNAIMAAYGPGARVVFADDDLTRISRRVSARQLEPVTDLPAEITQAFALAGHAGAGLWGIYPVHNPLFMKPRARTDLRYIIGCFYGVTVPPAGDPCARVTLEDKEDYERTLAFYSRDGTVLRLEWLAPYTRYYTEPGGMQETRTEARVTASARELARRYPHLAAFRRARSGHAELRLGARQPEAAAR